LDKTPTIVFKHDERYIPKSSRAASHYNVSKGTTITQVTMTAGGYSEAKRRTPSPNFVNDGFKVQQKQLTSKYCLLCRERRCFYLIMIESFYSHYDNNIEKVQKTESKDA
jgi:hypothetical protein